MRIRGRNSSFILYSLTLNMTCIHSFSHSFIHLSFSFIQRLHSSNNLFFFIVMSFIDIVMSFNSFVFFSHLGNSFINLVIYMCIYSFFSGRLLQLHAPSERIVCESFFHTKVIHLFIYSFIHSLMDSSIRLFISFVRPLIS